MQLLLVALLVAPALPLAGVDGLPDAVNQSTFIGRVHVDSAVDQKGRYAQRAELTVTEAFRGAGPKALSVLARDTGFSGVELSLVPGADQVVLLRRQDVGGKPELVVVEAFLVTKDGRLMLGNGSTTWWVMKPRPYADARKELLAIIAKDDRAPAPRPPPRREVRTDPDEKTPRGR